MFEAIWYCCSLPCTELVNKKLKRLADWPREYLKPDLKILFSKRIWKGTGLFRFLKFVLLLFIQLETQKRDDIMARRRLQFIALHWTKNPILSSSDAAGSGKKFRFSLCSQNRWSIVVEVLAQKANNYVSISR